jgi:hypothetical protein
VPKSNGGPDKCADKKKQSAPACNQRQPGPILCPHILRRRVPSRGLGIGVRVRRRLTGIRFDTIFCLRNGMKPNRKAFRTADITSRRCEAGTVRLIAGPAGRTSQNHLIPTQLVQMALCQNLSYWPRIGKHSLKIRPNDSEYFEGVAGSVWDRYAEPDLAGQFLRENSDPF